jgi:hypothetical protein
MRCRSTARLRVQDAAVRRGRNRSVRFTWTVALFGTAFASGCAPQIVAFDASLHRVCPGMPVEIAWKVKGDATLTASPPLPNLSSANVGSSGKMTLTPTATTTVELRATRRLGKPTSSLQQITVLGPPKAEPLIVSVADPSAGCQGDRIWGTVHASHFGPNVKVGMVTLHPGDGRSYEVEHGGISASVSPGVPASAFVGTVITGDWVLSSPLRPGERCGTPSLPRNLVVDVYAQCETEGAP